MKISPVVFPVLRLQALACAHLCSMSLKSGLYYGGRYSRVCPAALIRSCSSQRLKMSASTLASVNPTHNKTPAGSAPMTLTRPLAFQSCCPEQRCPHGAYPSVRGMSWAKPLSSISTMGRASRSRAHKHQSFPETPAARPGLLSGASGLFYMSRPVCQAPAIWPSVSYQTGQRDHIGRRRDGLSPPAQASPGRSFGPSDARGAWEQSA